MMWLAHLAVVCHLLLTTFGAAILLPLTENSSGTLPSVLSRQEPMISDVTSSGNYQIINCNTGKPQAEAEFLQQLLPLVRKQILRLLLDANRGTRSQHGFRAFFKSNKAIKIVRRVFEGIADGKPIPLTAERAQLIGSNTATPRLICVREAGGDPSLSYLMEGCRRQEGAAIYVMDGREVIHICPLFWHLPAGHTKEKCPTVVDNKLTPDDPTLVATMYGALVHELVHLYNPATRSTAVEGAEEVYDVQKAVDLDAKASLKNANNYALYAAGKQAAFVPHVKYRMS